MLKVATVFSGIGAFEFALRRLNIKHEIVFACDNGNVTVEYDLEEERKKIKLLGNKLEKKLYVDNLITSLTRRSNFVKRSYLENYKLDEDLFYQDICLLDGTDFKDEIDILVGGSPCQSFSSVGGQKGLEDARGTLFYEFARLIKETQPKVFVYENVRGLINHDKGNTWKVMKSIFNELGYTFYDSVMDSKEYGIPQTRRRLFVIGFKNEVEFSFPEKEELKFTMQDFLIEKNKFGSFQNKNGNIHLENKKGKIDDKYFLSEKLYNYVMKGGTKTFYQKPVIDKTIGRTILSTMGNRHRAGVDNYVTVNGEVRMLSEREAHRLMGFTDDYKIIVSRAQGYKQAGNSIVVDVLMKLIKKIIETGEIN